MVALLFALSVTYTPPAKAVGAPLDHVATITALAARIDHVIALPRPIVIAFRDCNASNAYYEATTHTLLICHQLWDERRKLYEATGTDREAAERLLRDSITYTVFHELGHALHHELDLPMLGRFEDVADDLATLLLIRLGLADVAANAARGHFLRSRQPGYTHDFRDEHGSGAQRAFAIGCLLSGRDPKSHAALMAELGTSIPKVAKCARDYPEHLGAWTRLLRDHLRSPSSSGS